MMVHDLQESRRQVELTINGIGKVVDTHILLEGITLVAGPNDIGKSTIGKTLFALVNSQYDFTAHMLREKIIKIERVIYGYLPTEEEFAYRLADYLSKTVATRIVKDLSAPAGTTLKAVGEWFTSQGRTFDDDQREQGEIDDIRRILLDMGDNEDKRARTLRVQCASIINDDAASYRRRFMENGFDMLFDAQINNRLEFGRDATASLSSHTTGQAVNATFRNDECLETSNTLDPRYNVLLIEDPRMITRVFSQRRRIPRFMSQYYYPGQTADLYDQEWSIIQARMHDATQGMSEHDLNARRAVNNRIISILDKAHQGTVDADDNGALVLRETGDMTEPIRVANASMGVKAVEFIKTILRRSVLDDATFLVLDEPEIHLHPEWQLVYAKALVLIARELHTRILVTTHSPYFLQALQTYMTDAGQADRFHVYVPDIKDENESCSFRQADDDDLDNVIAAMSRPFDELMSVQALGDPDLEA